jgi:hypothetical protein
MPRFGFVGPSYRSQSVNADCQTCINFYVETVESGVGKGPLALYRTPGLNLLYNLGNAPVRGLITAQGRTFCVAGTTLWELLAPTANPNKINRGQVVSDGQPASLAYGPTQVLIASGGNLYCFQLAALAANAASGAPALAANSLNLIAQFNANTGYGLLGFVSQVVYGDGFFFALISNSNQIQASNALDGSTWQGVNYTQVSVFSDNVNAIFVDHRLLCVFGPNAIQPYYDSGDFPFPYDVIEGAFIEQGLAAPNSPAHLDNSVFWLGQDSRGNGIVWRANGYQPVRVSTHALEYELGTYATIADAVCYGYQDQGHTFYVMNFPTAQKTWVYDCATQMWHQRAFWNLQAGKYTQSRAGFHTFNFGIHLVGDPTTGSVYQQSITYMTDFGNPIRRQRRAPHISTEQAWQFHLKLQIDVETGVGSVPAPQGKKPPTCYVLEDEDNNLWNFSIGDGGIIQAPPLGPLVLGPSSPVATLALNDMTNTSSWQITMSTSGQIQPLEIPFNANLPAALQFVSFSGSQLWNLTLNNVDGVGILQAAALGIIGRGPQMVLRWSNDGGHTWSNEHPRDCGEAGDYKARVYWNRLGRSRDRVYEITVTDPIPWAIIDAYLFTDPEDKAPKDRFARLMSKQA